MTLQPVLNIKLGERPENCLITTQLSENYALGLFLANATLQPFFTISLTLQAPEPYQLIGKSTLNTIRFAATDDNGEWVSGEVGSQFKLLTDQFQPLIDLEQNKTYTLLLNPVTNINPGSRIIELKGKFLSKLNYFFDNEIEDLIEDNNITISKDEFGIHTFLFKNYQATKFKNIILGALYNATTFGILRVDSYITSIASYIDRFNLKASVLININPSESRLLNGVIKVYVEGNGQYQEQGLIPTNFPIKNPEY